MPASHPLESCRDPFTRQPIEETLGRLIGALREAKRVCLVTHLNPDGDALGSTAALAAGLASLGKAAIAVVYEPIPAKMRSFFQDGLFRVVPDADAAASLEPADLFVVLDTSEPGRLASLAARATAPGQRRVCIDHHKCAAPGDFAVHLVVTDAPSTASLVLAILERLQVTVTKAIATWLWVGLATDTGWFRFENAGPWAFLDAATLAARALDLPGIHRQLYEELAPGRARVLGAALKGIRSELEGRLVWTLLRQADLAAAGVRVADLDGVVDHLKSVAGAEVAALVLEMGPGEHKISLRSRGDIDVEVIARRHGGGGHAKAAGCRMAGGEDAVREMLVRAVGEVLPGSRAAPGEAV